MKFTTCISAFLLLGATAMMAQGATEAQKNRPVGMSVSDSFTSRLENVRTSAPKTLKIPATALPANVRCTDNSLFLPSAPPASVETGSPFQVPSFAGTGNQTLNCLVDSEAPWVFPTGLYSISRTTAPASYPESIFTLSPMFNLYGVLAGDVFITCEPGFTDRPHS